MDTPLLHFEGSFWDSEACGLGKIIHKDTANVYEGEFYND